ncbi:MAG: hypothetical protein Barrevirus27_7 [Barrevirus sp.]|uniref:Bacteriophage T5 Orf172 DNA-binding domain-containing protein n=1 Tax=Barrevirus sp. TaxID=2487763 RepID=A0A3G4ZQU5_9VIRU|nr:MAG: hypothetical protein Barrevirus27_7 [Barrevirus sp.]
MKAFIIKYSAVPTDFVEDFFDIAKEEYSDNEFEIDFNIVVDWLDVRKDNLKTILVKNFSNKTDYIIESIIAENMNGIGSHHEEIITLTPDCFKGLCMLSHTGKAKEVRYYYLTVEKLIRKYHWLIEERLRKMVQMLEYNQKPKTKYQSGVVYILPAFNVGDNGDISDSENSNLYKLGKSSNMTKRMLSHNSPMANDIKPLYILEVNDIHIVENCVKMLAKKYKYRSFKEIYQIDFDLLRDMYDSCDTFVKAFDNYDTDIDTDENDTDTKFEELKHVEGGLLMYIEKD